MATLQEIRYKAYLALKKDRANMPAREPTPTQGQTLAQPAVDPNQRSEKVPSVAARVGQGYNELEGRIYLNNDEKIYKGSFGIDPVLIRLNELLTIPSCKINTILINVATCVRNAMDKDLSRAENIKKIDVEVQTIAETIADIYNRSVIGAPYLVFYMNDYHHQFPKEKLRPITPGKADYYDLLDFFFRALDKHSKYSFGKTTVNFVKCNHGIDYGNQLQNILRGISQVIPTATYNGYYCLVSHQPLDFHVMNKCPLGVLIASHTGELINNKMLGYKVFKEEHVPYSMLLHGLLGDKEQIKPAVSTKVRAEIKKRAFTNKWYLKSEMFIKQELRNIGIIVK